MSYVICMFKYRDTIINIRTNINNEQVKKT